MTTNDLLLNSPRAHQRVGGVALFAVMAALSGLAGGCADNHLIIEEDLNERPFECGLKACTPGLRAPFVRGAIVSIDVRDDRRLRQRDFSGWTLASDDESVFVVTSQELGTDNEWMDVETMAVGEGTTDLLLLDETGDVRARSTVEVRVPSHITLLHRGTEESLPLERAIRVVDGQTGTFVVHYWEGDTRLYGSGVASTESEVVLEDELALSAQVVADRGEDHVQFTPEKAGSVPVSLGFGGEESVTLEVLGVAMEELGGVDLVRSGSFDGREGVFARAVDLDGERVYGAQALWSADMEPLEGIGDVCLYSPNESAAEVRLKAVVGDLSEEATIRGTDPSVHSTNDFSCSVAGGGGASAWGLMLLALGALRRRRTSALS